MESRRNQNGCLRRLQSIGQNKHTRHNKMMTIGRIVVVAVVVAVVVVVIVFQIRRSKGQVMQDGRNIACGTRISMVL